MPPTLRVLWISRDGSRVFQPAHPQHAGVRQLLERGIAVFAIDHVGLNPQAESIETVPNDCDAAGYTFGYNSPAPVERARDYAALILTQSVLPFSTPRPLVAFERRSVGAAALTALACESSVRSMYLRSDGFRWSDVDSIRSPEFLPGISRFGDLPGVLATLPGCRTYLEGESVERVSQSVSQLGLSVPSHLVIQPPADRSFFATFVEELGGGD